MADELYETMRGAPSTRHFTEDPVPKELIDRVLDNARFVRHHSPALPHSSGGGLLALSRARADSIRSPASGPAGASAAAPDPEAARPDDPGNPGSPDDPGASGPADESPAEPTTAASARRSRAIRLRRRSAGHH